MSKLKKAAYRRNVDCPCAACNMRRDREEQEFKDLSKALKKWAKSKKGKEAIRKINKTMNINRP